MRIVVKSSDGPNIRLPIPSGLVLNRFAAGLAPRFLNRRGVELTKEQARAFVRELNRFRHRHRDWVLLEMTSADGDYVKIKL